MNQKFDSVFLISSQEKETDLSRKIELGFGPNGLGILSVTDVSLRLRHAVYHLFVFIFIFFFHHVFSVIVYMLNRNAYVLDCTLFMI